MKKGDSTGKAKNKKRKVESEGSQVRLYYKYEDEYIVKASDFVVTYKYPLAEKELDNLENLNEPIYKAIGIIEYKKYLEVVSYLLSNNNK